jgi:hypothetical protein
MAKATADIRALARAHTETCINVLSGIVRSAKVAPAARVAAVGLLLDRGWGKAEQAHTGPDGGDIRVTIRQIVENASSIKDVPAIPVAEEDEETESS